MDLIFPYLWSAPFSSTKAARSLSIHSSSYKRTALSHLVQNIIQVPVEPLGSRRELERIKHIARTDDLRLDIDRMIQKKLIIKRLNLRTSLPREAKTRREKWIRLPYSENISFQLRSTLRPFGFCPVFYTPLPSRRCLSNSEIMFP